MLQVSLQPRVAAVVAQRPVQALALTVVQVLVLLVRPVPLPVVVRKPVRVLSQAALLVLVLARLVRTVVVRARRLAVPVLEFAAGLVPMLLPVLGQAVPRVPGVRAAVLAVRIAQTRTAAATPGKVPTGLSGISWARRYRVRRQTKKAAFEGRPFSNS
jgi:hypothetical protein